MQDDAGSLAEGVLDEGNHHGAVMSSMRSGLVRRVWARSEAGSCTARAKRARFSGVSAAHILSMETHFSTPSPELSSIERAHVAQVHPGVGADERVEEPVVPLHLVTTP